MSPSTVTVESPSRSSQAISTGVVMTAAPGARIGSLAVTHLAEFEAFPQEFKHGDTASNGKALVCLLKIRWDFEVERLKLFR